MDPLDAARALLPAWVPWLPLALWVPAAAAMAWALTGLGGRLALGGVRGLPPDAPWVERARQGQPASALVTTLPLLVGALLATLALKVGGPYAAVGGAPLGAGVALAAYAAGLPLRARAGRLLRHVPARARSVARDDLVLWLLLAPHVLVIVALTAVVGAPLDALDAAALALGVAATAALLRGHGLTLLAAIGLARPAPPRVVHAVHRAAERTGIPPAPAHVVPSSMANAVAFPLAGRLAFTTRALEVLDDEALEALAAHELGHLGEPRRVRWARAAVVFALLPLGLLGWVGARFSLTAVMLALGAVMGLLFALRAWTRRLEARADAVACAGEESTGAYARALERIYAANGTPAVVRGRRGSHPHLVDRMLAAGVTPDWPRPAPPPQLRSLLALGAVLLPLIVLATALAGLPILLRPAAAHSATAASAIVALRPGADGLLRRALLEEAYGDPERTLVFAEGARALDPSRHTATATIAMALGRLGRCRDAADEADWAQALAPDGAQDPWVRSARAWAEECAAPQDAAPEPGA